MENEMTLRQFCERYRRGDFLSKDRKVQIEAGCDYADIQLSFCIAPAAGKKNALDAGNGNG